MNLIRKFSPLIILTLLLACSESKKPIQKSARILADTFQKATEFISNRDLDLTLASNIEEIDLTHFKLYGKFFNNRVEFYTSNNLNTNILNSKVEHITLYFIDGVLAKSQYIINENIISHLVSTYGKFRFAPLNWKNRDIARTEPILKKEAGQYKINSKLDNYHLKWSLPDKSLIYKKTDSVGVSSNQYTYTEVLNHYKEVFKQIEIVESL